MGQRRGRKLRGAVVYTGFIAVSLGRVAVCREIIAIFGAGMAVSTADMAIFPASMGQPVVFVSCPRSYDHCVSFQGGKLFSPAELPEPAASVRGKEKK